jgi:MATE family multidrug resistance protein
MGATAAAGHQVALTLASMSFMFPLGIASATTILVGRAVGRQDPAATRRAGFVGLGFGLAVMSLAAALFFAVPRGLARLLTDKTDVLEVATPLMLIAAVFQLFDGAQVGAGALRGCGDTRFVQWANVVGHYLVGLPVAVALGFGLGMGPQGLWWGLSAGLVSVSVALAVRFERLSRRVIARL